MIGVILFARSRRWATTILIAAASGVLVILTGPLGYSINPRGGYLVAVAAQLPLITAIAIQASLGSSAEPREVQASRSIRMWRVVHILVLVIVASAILGTAAVQLEVPLEEQLSGYSDFGAFAMIRNLLALTGAALTGSALIGASFGWILPLAWSTLPFLALRGSNADPSGVLTLLIQPDNAFVPFVAATTVWISGTVAITMNWTFSALVGRGRFRSSRRI